jgi:hypothetical protein
MTTSSRHRGAISQEMASVVNGHRNGQSLAKDNGDEIAPQKHAREKPSRHRTDSDNGGRAGHGASAVGMLYAMRFAAQKSICGFSASILIR